MKEANKEQPYIKRKTFKSQINRQLKFTNKSAELAVSPTEFRNLKLKIKQNESFLNVSLIEGSSFISNKHDGSLDSMDKMIIGVATMGINEKEFEEESQKEERSKESMNDEDFTEIHKQYQKLIGRNQLLGEQQEQCSEQIEENSRVLPDEDDWPLKEAGQIQKRLSFSLSPKKPLYNQNQIKLHLQRIQLKVDELKPKKSQDISNNSIKILVGNLGNLSQIHQQRENLLNASVDTDRKRNNQEDEQQFIDFVRQPDPQENNETNQKKHEFSQEHEVNQWLVTPVLQNLQLQLKEIKKNEKSANYQQILQALNYKEEEETSSEILEIFRQRQEWIKTNENRSESWKKKQLSLLWKMKKILKNPQYDSEDSEE